MSSGASSENMGNELPDVAFQKVTNAPPTTMQQIAAWVQVLEVIKGKLLAKHVVASQTLAFKRDYLFQNAGDCGRAVKALELFVQAAEVGWRSYLVILSQRLLTHALRCASAVAPGVRTTA